MSFYNTSFRKSNSPRFAREATLDAFGRKAIHYLENSDFTDREPGADLEDADAIIDGRQAVSRWLVLACTLEGEEAKTAYETADELRQVLGLEWADLLGRKAA